MRFICQCSLLILVLCAPLCADENLYGPISEHDYLTGRFDPAKHQDFVELNSMGVKTNGRKHYLRRDTAKALKRMMDAFSQQNPSIPLYITSSTRNYNVQRYIWNAKFTGKRKVDGKSLNKSEPDIYKRVLKILTYSSMPGTSRHHWGTDFDFNTLLNSYYKKGEGKIIYQWLTENGSKYGFYEVYTAGRNDGYNDEMWHWSYRPVSQKLVRRWEALFAGNTAYFAKKGSFGGSEYASELALRYVTSINPKCL